MNIDAEAVLNLCLAVLCLAAVCMHLVAKNRNEALLYGVQSAAVVGLMVYTLTEHFSIAVLAMALVTLIVKVFLAPWFLMRLVRRHQVKHKAGSYLREAGTLAWLLILLVLAGSGLFAPLTHIVPAYHSYLVLALAAMFISIALMVNRRGALSQISGVLSLENSIVAFATLAGLEQSAVLQVGVIFDITVWLVVAVTMVSLVFRHHGTLDISKLTKLKDY